MRVGALGGLTAADAALAYSRGGADDDWARWRARAGARAAAAAAELGPAFVKLGQSCASRPDLVGAGEFVPAGSMLLLVAQILILTGFGSARSAVEAYDTGKDYGKHERVGLLAEVEAERIAV